jgi:anti-anti-sigma regulatory factor
MKFVLIVSRGKKRGMPIPIEVDLFLIGSAKMCQLRAEHPNIGEQHCAFAVRGRKVFLRDLGSGKATMVNGEVMPPSEEWPLHKGDTVAVGPLEFRINFHEKQLSQRDLEEWALKQLDEDTGPKVSALEELEAVNTAAYDRDDAASVANAIIGRLNAQKGVLRGRLRISQDGGVTLVRIQDVYLVDDAELVHLKKELHDNLNHPNLRVLLDFKNVRRMSTAAAELLAELVQWLRRFGSTLAMCRLRPELDSMMQGMQSLYGFRIFAEKETALAQRW